jgi:hypothetical protein
LKKIFKGTSFYSIISETTLVDRIIFIFLIVISITGIFIFREFFPSGSLVNISARNRTVYKLPLDEDRLVSVRGSLGNSIVEIKDGKVHMKDSPCPRKLCVKQGWTDRGSITCLPNGVVVTVSGDQPAPPDSLYDGITR